MMKTEFKHQKNSRNQPHLIITAIGILLFPLIWVTISYIMKVPERYLPAPNSVLLAAFDIEPNIFIHAWKTLTRLIIGFFAGSIAGVLLGIFLYRIVWLRHILFPTLQAVRALPPVAAIPFFLLWFGFSDAGKWLLVIMGAGVNLAFTSYQILIDIPERYIYALNSFGIKKESLPWNISVPLVLDRLLPTLRFSLAVAIGLIIVSELLGSQVGLGYLIQSARSTFSLQTIFLSAILLSVMNALGDWGLVSLWKTILFWRQT